MMTLAAGLLHQQRIHSLGDDSLGSCVFSKVEHCGTWVLLFQVNR